MKRNSKIDKIIFIGGGIVLASYMIYLVAFQENYNRGEIGVCSVGLGTITLLKAYTCLKAGDKKNFCFYGILGIVWMLIGVVYFVNAVRYGNK